MQMRLTRPQVLPRNVLSPQFHGRDNVWPSIFISFLCFLLSAGYCLMQRAARAGSEAAALFLATHGAKVNHVNKWVRMMLIFDSSNPINTLKCKVFLFFLCCPAVKCCAVTKQSCGDRTEVCTGSLTGFSTHNNKLQPVE